MPLSESKDYKRLADKWLTEKRKISAEKKSRILPLAQIIEEEITGLLEKPGEGSVLKMAKKAAQGSGDKKSSGPGDPEALKLANAFQEVIDNDPGRAKKHWTKHIPVFLRIHAEKGMLSVTGLRILQQALTLKAGGVGRKDFRAGIARVLDQYIGGWKKEPNKSKKVFKAKGPGMTSAKAPMTIDPNAGPGMSKKPASSKKKPKMVSGKLGDMITVPRGAVPAPPFYRIKDRDKAMHKDDPRWSEVGYAWMPVPPFESKGPPGWLGHRIKRTLEEMIKEQEKTMTGPLHFHHPKWAKWKLNGGKFSATHSIGRFGKVQVREPLTRDAQSKPVDQKKAVPPSTAKDAAPPEKSPAKTEDNLQIALGKMKRAYDRARSRNLPYQPNFEKPDKIFRNLTPEEIEIAQDAWTNLTTDRWPKPGTKAAAAEKSKVKKDVTDIDPVRLVNTIVKYIEDAGPKIARNVENFLQRLYSTFTMTPEQEQEVEKAVNKKAVKVDPEKAWINKSYKEAVRLTKKELERLGFTEESMRAYRDRRHRGKKPLWMWGGLMSLRRRHPLRRKYKAWYKSFYSPQQRRRRKAARRAARRR